MSKLRNLFSHVPGIGVLRGGFARNVAMLSGGTALAQLINLAVAPVITRFYAPADVGQLALFTSFLSVASVLLALRYELGIIAANTDREAAQLVALSVLLTLPSSVLCAGLFYGLVRFHKLGFGSLPGYAGWLMFAALCLSSGFAIMRYWEIRDARFAVVSRATVFQNAARSFVQVVLGGFRLGPLGLLVGELCGRAAGLQTMFRNAYAAVRQHGSESSGTEFRAALKEHRKFPLYSLPSSFMDTFSSNAPVPLLALLYGAGTAGHFALVLRVMALPVSLLAANIADVFHSRLAVYVRESPENCGPLFRRTALGLLLLGAAPAAVLVFAGKPLFVIVFGSRWAMAGAMAGLVAPWFLGLFVVSPLSRAVLVLRGQEFKLIYDLLTVGSGAVVFWLAHVHRFPPLKAVLWLSLVNTFSYAIYFLILMYLLARTDRAVSRRREEPATPALAFSEGRDNQ